MSVTVRPVGVVLDAGDGHGVVFVSGWVRTRPAHVLGTSSARSPVLLASGTRATPSKFGEGARVLEVGQAGVVRG